MLWGLLVLSLVGYRFLDVGGYVVAVVVLVLVYGGGRVRAVVVVPSWFWVPRRAKVLVAGWVLQAAGLCAFSVEERGLWSA